MHTTGRPGHFSRINFAARLGLLALLALAPFARAQEQPKPGPEHRKMEVAVGDWTYEGSGGASPFAPAGSFKGRTTARMVLGGFFLESRSEDTGDTGYVFQGVSLRGFNPVTKTYFEHGFENDGRATTASITVNGGTWTSTGVRTDSQGKTYKTRGVDTYSADGRTGTFAVEYSADDGKTWLPLWKGTMKRVGN